MKKLALVAVLAAAPAYADDFEQHRALGVDAAVVVPVGDYGRAATVGAGALVRLEFPVATGGAVFGRSGVILHDVKSDYVDSLTLVPIYFGYKHPLGGGAYVAGEIGITLAWASADTQLGRMSDSDSETGAMFSAGLRRGRLDLRGALFLPDIDNATGFMASAGYDFAGF